MSVGIHLMSVQSSQLMVRGIRIRRLAGPTAISFASLASLASPTSTARSLDPPDAAAPLLLKQS